MGRPAHPSTCPHGSGLPYLGLKACGPYLRLPAARRTPRTQRHRPRALPTPPPTLALHQERRGLSSIPQQRLTVAHRAPARLPSSPVSPRYARVPHSSHTRCSPPVLTSERPSNVFNGPNAPSTPCSRRHLCLYSPPVSLSPRLPARPPRCDPFPPGRATAASLPPRAPFDGLASPPRWSLGPAWAATLVGAKFSRLG